MQAEDFRLLQGLNRGGAGFAVEEESSPSRFPGPRMARISSSRKRTGS